MKYFATLLLPIIFLAGCNKLPPIDAMKRPDISQDKQRTLLVGTWYGEATTKEGATRQQITNRLANGNYQVNFRLTNPEGKIIEATEVGTWGTSGPIYFTITRGSLNGSTFQAADTTDAGLNDAYQILELTEKNFRYRSLQTNNEYSLSRVENGFQFPAR